MAVAEGNSGGTVDAAATAEAGSQSQGMSQDATQGADGAQAQEPMVQIGDRQVPVSQVENALKVEARFTPLSQELAQRQKEIDAREQQIAERELANSSLQGVGHVLSNPDVAKRVAEVAPEIIEAMPKQQQVLDTRLIAENLTLKFNAFASAHPEFTDDELAGIRKEMVEVAKTGDFDGAQDFETIGFRLYRDSVIERERAQAVAAAQQQAQAAGAANVMAGVVGTSVPTTPRTYKLDDLTPEQKLAVGHAERSARK